MNEVLFSLIKKFIAILYCGLIIFLSHQSTIPMPPVAVQFIDKFYHFLEFGLCAVLIYSAWSYKNKRILVGLIIFALSDEIHQYFIQGRSCSIFDFIADIIAILTVYFILRFKDKEKPLLL